MISQTNDTLAGNGRGEQPVTMTSAEILSILRHELRTPINAIIGYSEMWLDEDAVKGAPLLRADLEKLHLAGHQLQSLVSDILDPARHDTAAELDVRGLGVILRHAFRMPVCAVLGYGTELAERHESTNLHGFAADLQRIETATRQLVTQAEVIATRGSLPSGGPRHQSSNPLHEHVAAMATRFRSPGPRSLTSTAGRERILVVDDNESNRDLLARRMRSLGYSVVTAPEGVTALEKIERREFDLVLLDVVMPLMSGIEVLKCIRCTYSVTDLPVIMITARDECDDIVHALENGANDYLTKPLALPVVTARVQTQLMLRRMVGELEKANLKLETLSLHDALTQVANRRSFDEAFAREKRRINRNGRPLTLLILDIDYFKKYNDTYGHKAGDGILCRVAKTIVESLERVSDMAFRYGGEEFVVLLPDCDEYGSAIVAERIRLAIERLAIPHAGSPQEPFLTVSIGTATAVKSSDDQLADLFDQADQMLYRAKAEGRNRVCRYER